MKSIQTLFILSCLVLVSGCARIPGLQPPAPSAETPALLTAAELATVTQNASAHQARDPGAALSNRANTLQARARAMRGPVHDPDTRARLARAISGS